MLTVAPVEAGGVRPVGRPGLVQWYGDVPPDAVQLAEYANPTSTGPVAGTQFIEKRAI
jgi:hypothetical protein